MQGNVKVIRALAEHGADINIAAKSGATPVYIAAQEGHIGVVIALAELGACLNTANRNNATPVYIAALEGHADIICALAEHGADINIAENCGTTPVFMAAQEGYVAVLRALAEHGADINTAENSGATPVFIAAQQGHVDFIRALAEHGADINTAMNNGATPVLIASHNGHEGVIRALAELRADIDVVSSNGSSPLLVAVQTGHRSASVLLVNIGADVRQCMLALALRYDIEHICEMVGSFCAGAGLSTCAASDYDDATLCMFSLTKLLSSASLDLDLGSGGGSDDAADNAHLASLETNIAISMGQLLLPNAVKRRMQETCYVLKRRLVRIAWRVYQSTLLLDGGRLTAVAKARRYVEVACFLFDSTMLGDVLALRMTCQSNNYRRRFPVYRGGYCELEANIIEECVAYASCRFVSTDVIYAVIVIHGSY
jgi:ankyrin repeat protein